MVGYLTTLVFVLLAVDVAGGRAFGAAAPMNAAVTSAPTIHAWGGFVAFASVNGDQAVAASGVLTINVPITTPSYATFYAVEGNAQVCNTQGAVASTIALSVGGQVGQTSSLITTPVSATNCYSFAWVDFEPGSTALVTSATVTITFGAAAGGTVKGTTTWIGLVVHPL